MRLGFGQATRGGRSTCLWSWCLRRPLNCEHETHRLLIDYYPVCVAGKPTGQESSPYAGAVGLFDLRDVIILGTMAQYDAMGWDADELLITTLPLTAAPLDEQVRLP